MSRRKAPKVVYAGGYEGTTDFPDHRHAHAWELIYLGEGSIRERIGKEVREMEPGTFILLPPSTVHGDSPNGRYFLYHVLVASEHPLGWPRFGNDLEGEPIRAVLDLLVREWYSNGIQREAVIRHCASMLDVLMKRCAVQAEESQVARNVVATVCGHFRRDFRSSLKVETISRGLNISRSTLFSYFRIVLDRTPQSVLDSIRLEHAVYLLKHSELPIEQVALGSGFCSSSHLGRKLRRAFQMTARQIRESCVEQVP
ncbi:MAG: helix-turn-helix transcriptional regulator [Armatimonadetes bacterium]|nr:helix-turn-helix transcriptional regulator [Armatimonadota bacterium]